MFSFVWCEAVTLSLAISGEHKMEKLSSHVSCVFLSSGVGFTSCANMIWLNLLVRLLVALVKLMLWLITAEKRQANKLVHS